MPADDTSSHRRTLLLGLLGAATGVGATAQPAAGPWADAVRRHGLVLLIRHARTEPGIGDPPGFALGQCSTQRNLSAEGREQSARLGELLRSQGLVPQAVRSSAWCRCQDTARLAFGSVEPWKALDSFFGEREREPGQTAQLARALAALPPGRVEAWVTHMVNVGALTGRSVAMGECLLIAGGGPPEREPLARLSV